MTTTHNAMNAESMKDGSLRRAFISMQASECDIAATSPLYSTSAESSFISLHQHQSPLSVFSAAITELESPSRRTSSSTKSMSIIMKLNSTADVKTEQRPTLLPKLPLPLSRKHLSGDSVIWDTMLETVTLAINSMETVEDSNLAYMLAPTMIDNTHVAAIVDIMRHFVLKACQVVYDEAICNGKSADGARLSTELGNIL